MKIKEAISTSLKRTSHASKNKRRDKDTKRARKFFEKKKQNKICLLR